MGKKYKYPYTHTHMSVHMYMLSVLFFPIIRTESNFTLCLISGDKKASLNKIKKTLRIKDASMASAENVKNITGFSIGGVSPIGHLNKIDILIDKSLMRFDILYAAAGHPNCVFKTNFEDLKKITNGLDEEICE